MASRAVFLDKDGTLVEDIPYNVDPELIRPTEGAIESLRQLQDAGYKLIVVSNQSGVARGIFREEALTAVETRLRAILSAVGVSLTGFYYCPHLPQATLPQYAIDCACRKPRPGLLLRGAREHDIDLSASWMIGDILNDMQAGKSAGCRTILVDNGHETEWILTPERRPDFLVKNLPEAAETIFGVDFSLERIVNDGTRQRRSN
jgi:D-glycero-D-manno-heptose 1,7-bisphosphate phosphatase